MVPPSLRQGTGYPPQGDGSSNTRDLLQRILQGGWGPVGLISTAQRRGNELCKAKEIFLGLTRLEKVVLVDVETSPVVNLSST
ncbi:hypothetical protein MRX96_020591 [Rhipicephalus microplus]